MSGVGSQPSLSDTPLVHLVSNDISDHTSIGEVLTHSGYEVVVYFDPEEFLSTFCPRDPQCFVLDMLLPRMSGLELQHRLLAQHPGSSVVLMNVNPSARTVVHAFRQGAADFLEKPWRSEELLDCIGRAIKRDRASGLQHTERSNALDQLGGLTAREREVLALIVEGKSSRDVAQVVGISKRTVDSHRASLMRKLGAHSVVDLVRIALLAAGASVELIRWAGRYRP